MSSLYLRLIDYIFLSNHKNCVAILKGFSPPRPIPVTFADSRIKLARFPQRLPSMPTKTAVILSNLGTPDDLTKASVKSFLNQFLSDPWVVEVPRPIWWLILNLIILPFRSPKTLAGYSRVWMDDGSPLMVLAKRQQLALQQKLGDQIPVVLAMRYGKPSLQSVVDELLVQGVNRLIVLPLYPQNSATTTATTFHHLSQVLANRRDLPSVSFIDNYHEHPAYIDALAESVRAYWQLAGQQNHLLMSFHGLPQVNVDRGDPYYGQCLRSADLLAENLGLSDAQWSLSFQSRFGKQQWLKPYTADVLGELVNAGTTEVDVICPGFSADCLETLDEIKIEYRELYIQQGGKQLNYIAALNDNEAHIEMMQKLVTPYLTDSMFK
ncbi:MAG: ferrochelatase [Gammaproteobacteria bacterium]|jgi:ferrochelatase